jgi:hypothetical protein
MHPQALSQSESANADDGNFWYEAATKCGSLTWPHVAVAAVDAIGGDGALRWHTAHARVLVPARPDLRLVDVSALPPEAGVQRQRGDADARRAAVGASGVARLAATFRASVLSARAAVVAGRGQWSQGNSGGGRNIAARSEMRSHLSLEDKHILRSITSAPIHK